MTAADGPSTLPPSVAVTEAEMADTLRDACRWTGWRCAHFRPAMRRHGWRTAVQGDGKGFPDWVLVHDRGGVLFVELKADRAAVYPTQQAWGEALIRAGAIYRVVQGGLELNQFCRSSPTGPPDPR